MSKPHSLRSLLIGILLCTLGGCDVRRTEPNPPSAAAPVAAQAAALASPPADAGTKESATVSFASFKKDNLRDCVTVSVSAKTSTLSDAGAFVTVEQAAVMLAYDFVEGAPGVKTILGEGKGSVNLMLTAFLNPQKLAAMAKKKVTAEATAKFSHQMSQQMSQLLARPPKSIAARITSGELAKVDGCELPSRVALATCTIEDSSPDLSWRVEQRHFSVATTLDTDAGFKRCLALSGKWAALDRDDPAVVRERLRQHAGKLKELVGD